MLERLTVTATGCDVLLATSIFLSWNIQINRYYEMVLCGFLVLGPLKVIYTPWFLKNLTLRETSTSAAGIPNIVYHPESTGEANVLCGKLHDPSWTMSMFNDRNR